MVNALVPAAALALALGAAETPPATPSPPAVPPPSAPGGVAAPGEPAAREVALQDALAELDRQNLTLAQARSRVDEADGLARQAAAGWLPTLTASGSYVRNSDELVVSLPTLGKRYLQPLDQLSGTGTLRVPLLAPTAWFEGAAARDAARAAAGSEEAVRFQVRAGFVQGAYAARAAEEVVTASIAALASAEELVRSAQRREAVGTAAPLDVLRAQTEQVRRASDLAAARATLARARLALGVVLGRAAPVRVTVPEPPDAGAPGDADALAAEALGHRPELRAAAAQREAAEAQVRAAWSRLLPQVSASASVFAARPAYPTGDETGWRASVDLVWPLYDGGFRYGKRRQAQAQAAQAREAADAERLAVVQEALDAARDLDVARERLRLAVSQRRLAADAAASAKRSFDAGIASSLDVIDANDRLYVADVGLADGRARLASAQVALARALGRPL